MYDPHKLIKKYDMIIISCLNEKDFDKVLEIEKTLFINPMTSAQLYNFSKQECFRIWKLDIGKIIGYVSFFKIKDEVEIIKIGIDKSYQRKNYGSYFFCEMKRIGINKIFLEVSCENIGAINFYLKNGFFKIGKRKAYYKQKDGSRIDAFTFSLKF